MKIFAPRPVVAMLLLMVTGGLNSCETSGYSGSGSAYYSGGYDDPWYYGGYYDDPDIIVAPPGNRPDRPLRPTHPIARPPLGGGGPRPMPHGGGGGLRR